MIQMKIPSLHYLNTNQYMIPTNIFLNKAKLTAIFIFQQNFGKAYEHMWNVLKYFE